MKNEFFSKKLKEFLLGNVEYANLIEEWTKNSGSLFLMGVDKKVVFSNFHKVS